MRNRLTNQPDLTRVSFLVPPSAQRVGGIDTALDGLSRHLTADSGTVLVSSETDFETGTDLVHFHGMWQTGHRSAYQRCMDEDIPYVVSPHGMLEPWAWQHKIWKKWPYFKLIERRQLQNAAAVIAASTLEAENLAKFVDPALIRVLPFGIDVKDLPEREAARQRLGFGEDERILLYFSRIDPKKGLDMLLDALRTAPAGGWRLVIVGNGDAEFTRELKAFAATHATELPPVTWTGGVWGLERWDYLVGADLFCLPTRSENFGFAVLEALWAGTPVLTTDTTPWAQHQDIDGVNVCSPSIANIHTALRTALTDAEFSAAQRDALRDWCKDTYHWHNVAEQYAETYRSLSETESAPCLVS
ncbi:MAG: glycosyltransferase [Verrucomicrobiae bacterium]|nr:glycosyltransferase [Verrucomicrobiae bacterium]